MLVAAEPCLQEGFPKLAPPPAPAWGPEGPLGATTEDRLICCYLGAVIVVVGVVAWLTKSLVAVRRRVEKAVPRSAAHGYSERERSAGLVGDTLRGDGQHRRFPVNAFGWSCN